MMIQEANEVRVHQGSMCLECLQAWLMGEVYGARQQWALNQPVFPRYIRIIAVGASLQISLTCLPGHERLVVQLLMRLQGCVHVCSRAHMHGECEGG